MRYWAKTIVAAVLFAFGCVLVFCGLGCGYIWINMSGDRSECSNGLIGVLAPSDCARVAELSDWTAIGTLLCLVFAGLLFWLARDTSRS